MQTTQGSLVMVGLNTDTPQIFWNGQLVDNIQSIQVVNDSTRASVVLKMPEEPVVAELKAAGVIVKREVV